MTWTDERIAEIPSTPPRAFRVHVGLDLTVRANGRKYFDVRAVLKNQGWTKNIRRMIGEWPQMSLAEAQAQAVYYRQLASKGVDFRRSQAELVQLTKAYMDAKHADLRDAKRLKVEARMLQRQAREEARRLKAEARRAERQQRQAVLDAAKPKRAVVSTTPSPELSGALTRQKLFNIPWSK